MILNFTRPQPDELLYSLVARHLWLRPLKSLKCMASRLFLAGHATAVLDLPGRLEALQASIGLGTPLTSSILIRNHTMLPLYAPFLPPARLAQVEQDLAGNGGGAVHYRTGIMASKIRPSSWLRFCPGCAAEERATTGEAYWHRLHQIAGVYVCPAHQMFLVESQARAQLRRTRQEFIPAQAVISEIKGTAIDKENPGHQTLVRIASGADWLLKNYRAGNEFADLRNKYLHHAMRLGFVTGTGRIQWQLLLEQFHQRFSPQLLQKLNCEVADKDSDHWMARILRHPRVVQAPIRHLVMMDYFGLTPAAFLQTEVPINIFGSGPWPCTNPVCPQRGNSVITEIQLEHSHEHRRPLGLLTCPVCGQVRCRVLSKDREIVWIQNYGPLWESELESLWQDPTVSLRQMARQLEADPLTVKRHAKKAGLPFPRIGKRMTTEKGVAISAPPLKSETADLAQRRIEWSALRQQFPTKSTAELRALAPACYTFLYRHDRDWHRSHCPERFAPTNAKPRVNWHIRDLQLSEQVSQAKAALRCEPGRPKRISLSALGRQLEALAWMQKHRAKLPLTAARLAVAVESHADFAHRRLAWQGSPNGAPVVSQTHYNDPVAQLRCQ